MNEVSKLKKSLRFFFASTVVVVGLVTAHPQAGEEEN